ncbi:MAG TPA: hypothetical protein VMD49_04960 [Steroidobacteraceae bacterium]|nr:hypothetical protein [Steroidobacteraceae bacterium]
MAMGSARRAGGALAVVTFTACALCTLEPSRDVRAAARPDTAQATPPNGAQATPHSATAAPQSAAPKKSARLDEVTVTAQKLRDRRTLNHEVARFVQSHAAPTAMIDQVARWHEYVCPTASGLGTAYDDLVSRRIVAVARSVGAPTRGDKAKCPINVEIVFTPKPQETVDYIAKRYRPLLGADCGSSFARFISMIHPIQAWYVTGTRSTDLDQKPASGLDTSSNLPEPDVTHVVAGINADSIDCSRGGLNPSGIAGSHLTKGLQSEFLHVLVIVDIGRTAQYSLRSIADYIAVLALTRMSSLDACNELPSIIDLLSTGCPGKAKPGSITTADTAYLTALYHSDPESNLNIEQGDIRAQMVSSVAGR